MQWSSDNVPVCCHDSSFVDQTTSETIVIADHTAAELKTYDYYGETIATFEEILAECKKQGVGLYIDKTGGFLINHDDRKAIIFGLITKYEMEDDVVFLVTVQAQVDALLAWYDKVSMGILANSTISSTEISLANGAYNGKNYVFIDAARSNNTTSDVATAKGSLSVGVKIELWTIDDVTQYKSYFPYVSGITSNKLSQYIVNK